VKTLVTGASGFVGREACAQLISGGHEVVALVRREGSQPEGTTPARGDLTDAASLGRTLDDHAPECVFHLAAELASQRNDDRVRDVNLEGTRRLIDAAVPEKDERPAPKIVFASTVVTGDAGGRLLTEDDPLPVETTYGETKQACERMLRESALPSVVVRPGHVYGAGGWYAEEIVRRLRQPPPCGQQCDGEDQGEQIDAGEGAGWRCFHGRRVTDLFMSIGGDFPRHESVSS